MTILMPETCGNDETSLFVLSVHSMDSFAHIYLTVPPGLRPLIPSTIVESGMPPGFPCRPLGLELAMNAARKKRRSFIRRRSVQQE